MSEDKDNKTEGEGSGSQKSSFSKKGRKKKRSNSKFESSGNTFKGPIPELEDHAFTYTRNIWAKQWLKSREAFISSYTGGKYGKDVRTTLTEMEVTIITAKAPASHDRETIKALTPLEAKNWEFDIKEYRIAAKELEDNLGIMFDKLWEQCDLEMQNKVKSHIGWKSAVKKSNVIELLEIINKICSSGNQSKYTPKPKGPKNKRNIDECKQRYVGNDIRECTRGLPGHYIHHERKRQQVRSIQTVTVQQLLPGRLLIPEDHCGRVHHVGQLQYLSRSKKEKNEESEGSKSDSSQDDNGVRNRYHNLTCYRCGRKGHITTICKAIEHIDGTAIATKNKVNEGEQQMGAMMLIDQSDSKDDDDDNTKSDVEDYLNEDNYNYQIGWTNCMKGLTKVNKMVVVEDPSWDRINPYWVLLDNQLAVHVFCQKSFLTNIQEGTEELHLYTNAGMTITTHVGDLPGFGSVWFHPEGIASVLLFDGVARTHGYMIEYNNLTMGNYFRVTNPLGEVKIFRPSRKDCTIGTANIYWQEARAPE
eukprot:jgi/Psemu1/24794/gm1.24794_g